MMEKDKLRKADIFSGTVIFLLGLWIISQALKMPMKDSWGGVQNVWFVSPALFPLLVGTVISLLGVFLVRTALKTVGSRELAQVFAWLGSSDLARFLKTAAVLRFYAMVVLFFCFVYLNIPRIDFFLCSVLFLMAFITMFYFDDEVLLNKLLLFYLAGTAIFIIYLVVRPFADKPHARDWFTLFFIIAYCVFTWISIRTDPGLRRKYRTSLILAMAAPFLIGTIFKYLLMVPMPKEGMVVALLDAIWYWDF